MKRAYLTPEGFRIVDEAMPTCGANEVLVETQGCGICEGDLFRYTNYMKRDDEDREPVAFGHEGSGVVVEVGANVAGFRPGDKVTACGGAYGEYFVVSAERLARIPAGVEVAEALGEPVACCMHAANRFGIKLGDRVGIIGCGFMGLVCLQLARLLGAAETVAFDLLDWRLDTAGRFGADQIVNPTGRAPADIARELGEFDVVIEATGVQAALDLIIELVRNHGTAVLVGSHHGGPRQFDLMRWNVKSLTVVNGHVRNHREKVEAMEAGLRLMAHGRLNISDLITNYRFGDVGQAFLDLEQRKQGLFKANLTVNQKHM